MTSTMDVRLTRELDDVVVADDGRTALVDGRELAAEHPRELVHQLALALYEWLHVGRMAGPALRKESPRLRRDREFEGALAAAVPHSSTRIEVVVVEWGRDEVLVERDGVRVWLPHNAFGGRQPRVGEVSTLVTDPIRPALSPGFFLVDGSRPSRSTLRVYVNLTDWEHAPPVWHEVLRVLEDAEVAYRAKVLSVPRLYPRRDALVVYLPAEREDAVALVAGSVAGLPGVGSGTSLFAQPVAPGVSWASEPSDSRPGMRGLSFGQHRARVFATALVDSATTRESRASALRRCCAEAAVDVEVPARNCHVLVAGGGQGPPPVLSPL